jgi:hypothetical protein
MPFSRVPIRQFIEDIRLATTDEELMQKYRITEMELRSMLMTLFKRGILEKADLDMRPGDYEDTVVIDLPTTFGR